jgi:hypothetical protein
MIDVKLDFQERVVQIEKYLAFVWVSDARFPITTLESIKANKILLDDGSEIELNNYLSDDDSFLIDNQLVKILKSNSILLFYNLIEGTISSLMNEFFGTLNSDPNSYKDLQLPIKKIWLKYKHRSFNTGNKKYDDYIINTIESILDEVVVIDSKTISDAESGERIIHNYDAFCSETNANDISGNIDARKIRELFSLYGLPEVTIGCKSMLQIKNKRNSLAHGNETFAQVGSSFTIEDLYKMKIEITSFLEHVLNETENYLNTKMYKIANA